jgi:hypothetical protein
MKPREWRVHNLVSIAMPFVDLFLLFSKNAYFTTDAGVGIQYIGVEIFPCILITGWIYVISLQV